MKFNYITSLILVLMIGTSCYAGSYERMLDVNFKGISIYHKSNSTGDIFLKVENLQGKTIKVHLDDIVVYCGGRLMGEKQNWYIPKFKLNAYESKHRSGWVHYQCRKDSYYLEIGDIQVD